MGVDQRPVEQYVSLSKYPLTERKTGEYYSLVEQCQQNFRHGACVLPRFVSPEGVAKLVEESETILPATFFKEVSGNAYLSESPADVPPDHVYRMTEKTSLGVIACDQIPEISLIKRLYNWDPLLSFVADVVNMGTLYRYGCPLGALNLSVMKNGDYLRWHFDQSDFVVSIAIQEPESGGDFECVNQLRSDEDQNFAGVRSVLEGDSSQVTVLPIVPGSLIFFRGKNTLHRVTSIRGERPRVVALLSYDLEPDTVGSEYLQEIRYGRTV